MQFSEIGPWDQGEDNNPSTYENSTAKFLEANALQQKNSLVDLKHSFYPDKQKKLEKKVPEKKRRKTIIPMQNQDISCLRERSEISLYDQLSSVPKSSKQILTSPRLRLPRISAVNSIHDIEKKDRINLERIFQQKKTPEQVDLPRAKYKLKTFRSIRNFVKQSLTSKKNILQSKVDKHNKYHHVVLPKVSIQAMNNY